MSQNNALMWWAGVDHRKPIHGNSESAFFWDTLYFKTGFYIPLDAHAFIPWMQKRHHHSPYWQRFLPKDFLNRSYLALEWESFPGQGHRTTSLHRVSHCEMFGNDGLHLFRILPARRCCRLSDGTHPRMRILLFLVLLLSCSLTPLLLLLLSWICVLM